MSAPNLQAAKRHIELLTGDANTRVSLRLIHDSDKSAPTVKRHGPVTKSWGEAQAFQSQGYGVFVVVNEGGDKDEEITRIRACFVDADDVPLPNDWHAKPDFIVTRDATHWHAYWLVDDCPINQFETVQHRLAARYGTDTAVCNPSRVMRLAGTLHQKDAKQ